MTFYQTLLYIALAVSILAGCSNALKSDDASIVSIDPISGSRLTGPITITFDDIPTGVSLSSNQGNTTWQLKGNTLTITDVVCYYPANSREGTTEISLQWDTGAQHISYECRKPLPPPPSATTVTANLPSGSKVPSNSVIYLTLDRSVDAVAGATGSGRRWEIPAAANLLVTWTNKDGSAGGPATFSYTLQAPDREPPRIIRGTVADGAKNVDPGPLNADKIQITFNENVVGTVELNFEDNTSTDWHGRIIGKKAELTPIAGRELDFATTYVIVLTVRDSARNKAEYRIKFTTRARD